MPRKSDPVDLRLLSKIGKLYYEQKLTQQEISERLRLSRPKISRLLQRAEEEGIIQITIFSPPGSYAELEQALENRFDLQEAVVVEVENPASPEAVARELGQAAANYLQRTLEPGDVLGLSWGSTLNAMVNALRPVEIEKVHIVQLLGGLGAPEAEVHATDLCRRIARLLNARLTLIPAPGVVNNQQIRQALLSDSHVQAAFDSFSSITVAYVGIGIPSPTSVVIRDGSIISPPQLDELLDLGAVGDIALRFFDASGQPIRSELDELVIGIDHNQLRQGGRVVGAAGGTEKLGAVYGALVGKWIDVLITDHALAQKLLDYCP
jgi:DNA-binding transcriptional regulator LsrR (DeoR family)